MRLENYSCALKGKSIYDERKRNIIHQLLKGYDIQLAENIQDVLQELSSGTRKEMMEAEMDEYPGYERFRMF